MKILLTGGAGFIASHIAEAYISEGHEVLIVDDLSTGKKENIPGEAHFEEVDIRSKKLKKIIRDFKPEVLNHHAAQINLRYSLDHPVEDAQINIIGMLNVINLFREAGGKKIIFASSGGAIYGETDTIPTPEETIPRPTSPYGSAKFAGEMYLYNFYYVYDLPYIALRYSNVYGPRQDPSGEAGVVAIFISKILNGERPVIFGDGEQTRDFVFVKDVAEANLRALHSDYIGAVNIGTSRETSVNELFDIIASLLNYHEKPEYGPPVTGELKRSALDNTLASRVLGWEPHTSLREGIGETVQYFLHKK